MNTVSTPHALALPWTFLKKKVPPPSFQFYHLKNMAIKHLGFTLRLEAWSPAFAPLNCACGAHFTVEVTWACALIYIESQKYATMCPQILTASFEPMTGEEVMSGLEMNIQKGAQLEIAADGFRGSYGSSNRHIWM